MNKIAYIIDRRCALIDLVLIITRRKIFYSKVERYLSVVFFFFLHYIILETTTNKLYVSTFLFIKLENKNLIWLFNESQLTLAFDAFYQEKNPLVSIKVYATTAVFIIKRESFNYLFYKLFYCVRKFFVRF